MSQPPGISVFLILWTLCLVMLQPFTAPPSPPQAAQCMKTRLVVWCPGFLFPSSPWSTSPALLILAGTSLPFVMSSWISHRCHFPFPQMALPNGHDSPWAFSPAPSGSLLWHFLYLFTPSVCVGPKVLSLPSFSLTGIQVWTTHSVTSPQ